MTVAELLDQLAALGDEAAEWRLVAELSWEPTGEPLSIPRRVDVIEPNVDDDQPSLDLVLRDHYTAGEPSPPLHVIVRWLREFAESGRTHFGVFVSELAQEDEDTGHGYCIDTPVRSASARPVNRVVVLEPWPHRGADHVYSEARELLAFAVEQAHQPDARQLD